jgi:signal recognition particle subunit SEC65
MNKYKKWILKTTNIIPKVKTDIKDFIDLISKKNYIEGVVLLGGLGKRNFLDKYSDLDIAIFYRPRTTTNHFLPFEFHAIINGNRYEFNIHQLFYEKEVEKDWSEEKKEAYSRARILVDKGKRIKKLINLKTVYDKRSAFSRLIWIMQQYVWRGQIHSLRIFYRGYPEGGHNLLNECVELLIEAVYILNSRHRPHQKWRIAMLTTMKLLPENFLENIRKAMLVLNFSIEDIEKRIKILNNIYTETLKLIKQKYPNFPKKPYEYYYRNFMQPKKNCFIQKTIEKLNSKMNLKDIQELEGKLCLNLVSSRKNVAKYLK